MSDLSKRILVVEDDPDGMEVLTNLLTLSGIGVESAGTVRDAWRKLSVGLPFAVAIIDVALPDDDGINLLKEIRLNEKLKRMQVIIVTAFHSSLVKKQALDAGCDFYMTKPINVEALAVEVERMLNIA